MKPLTENPWKIKTRIKVHETPWITVYHHDTLNPAGNQAVYTTVEFKNLAIGIIPIDDKKNIYLVGQYRFPIQQYSWEIPEGGCPPNEDPLTCAKRELKEETGIVAEHYQELTRLHLSNSSTNETAILYVAQNLSFKDPEPEESEVLALQKIPLQKAVQMVLSGQITDAMSVVGILLTEKLFL
jgi:8-oxo-dGTP pyrophosphatase MutT (NUDIX family)